MPIKLFLLVLIFGYICYLTIRFYLALLGCLIVGVLSIMILTLIYGILHLFGLA
jgi:hypothetical protein